MFLAIVVCALFSVVCSNRPKTLSEIKQNLAKADNQCVAKGGVGFISDGLYIVTNSPLNELILAEGKRWYGDSAPLPQLVAVRNDSTILESSLPAFGDFSRTVFVSFEADTIRFLDVKNGQGGYYVRTGPEENRTE
jgi:hypothetical protein